MKIDNLLNQIATKGSDKEAIAERIADDPTSITEAIEGLRSKKAPVKYGCGKVLRILSQRHPEALYPHINVFIKLLDSDNNIMKWEGIHVIGNLACVDKAKRIDAILTRYLQPIEGPVLITAANVIGGAAKIAAAKPHLAERIAAELLKVEHAQYATDECRNVALGQALDAFEIFFDKIKSKQPVIDLVTKQMDNTRSGTRKRAEKLLKKWQKR
ncbi:MAG: hypothetical protein WC333_05275 [Dehalococcoidia bacterium]